MLKSEIFNDNSDFIVRFDACIKLEFKCHSVVLITASLNLEAGIKIVKTVIDKNIIKPHNQLKDFILEAGDFFTAFKLKIISRWLIAQEPQQVLTMN